MIQPLRPAIGPELSVAVIGAGFAGLATAYFLRQLGFGVTVFEATTRTGGRVWSQEYPTGSGRLVEFGAELIGYNHAVWLGLAEVFGLNFSTMSDDEMFAELGLAMPMWLNGRLVGDPAPVWEGLDDVLHRLDAVSSGVNPYEPWKSSGAGGLDGMSVRQWVDSLQLTADVARAVDTILACDLTLPTHEQSFLGLLTQVNGHGGSAFWTDTEVMRCSSGNQSLATAMEEVLRANGVAVKYPAPVTAITLQNDRVAVTAGGGSPVPYHYVVLTVPPDAWRNITFTPALGTDVQMSTGPAVKFISACNRRFWLASRRAPNALSDVIGETWEATDNQTLWKDGQFAVLSVFSGADIANAMLDPKVDPARLYGQNLDQLYPGYSAHLAAQPKFLAWPTEPYILCGYSCPKLNDVTTVAPNLTRPYPRYNERLVFAGEHTCPPFFGFMEGALESGLMAMGQIAAKELRDWPKDNVVNALNAAAAAGRPPD